ncbi:hypothetical protein BpHYR1_000041 [Brachionus plicatilis]|uniref:Secreted protein n=1 Tax=Brachionus plicatilis TaxID=10195 RepID=A0A3M7QK61_BRAPC|nr:hypothetical protein BpHYR1_000041 [Brachionus plicatilis]
MQIHILFGLLLFGSYSQFEVLHLDVQKYILKLVPNPNQEKIKLVIVLLKASKAKEKCLFNSIFCFICETTNFTESTRPQFFSKNK